MKNFLRLVRFAWPYRLRFFLSIGCALLVAVLYFADIMAVYPLLQILTKSQNGQKWVAERIGSIDAEIRALEAKGEELRFVQNHLDLIRRDPRNQAVQVHNTEVELGLRRSEDALRAQEGKLDDAEGPGGNNFLTDRSTLLPYHWAVEVAKARRAELHDALRMVKRGESERLSDSQQDIDKQLTKARRSIGWYRRAQPWVNRWLPDRGFQTLLLLLGLLLVGVAVKGLFLFLQEVLVADTVQLSLFDIRNQFYRRTMALDLASFTDQGTADLMARFTSDIDSLSQGLNTLLSKMIREPLRIVFCLAGALLFNWRLTLLTLVLVPISAATTVRAGKIMKRAVRRALESMSSIYKILQESFQGIKVVKAFTNERHERRRFFLETKALYKKSLRVARIDALSDPVLEMLSLLTVMIALLAGSYLVLNREIFLHLGFGMRLQLASRPMALEDLLTLYALLASMADPIRKLANVHSKLQRAAAASDRICALMDRRPSVADKPDAVRLPRHRKGIEFEDVVFAYNGRDQVLRGLTLNVAHGETIALVGPNGCGKSTLVNLLPRFYDVLSGSIRIDGQDIRDVRMRSLRSQIGYVTQETVLFEGTLAENIAYGARHADRAAIEAAARRAYAHQFISALPQGYDTPVSERGLSLSGGQRQRIALARVMLRDPAILILDEATSAVDIQDEALIRKAIEEFSRVRTTFLITHSLGSLQFAHRIALMNLGRIEAIGTDAELRHSSFLYRRLHEIHFQRESA